MGAVKAMWMEQRDMSTPKIERTPVIEAWAFKGQVYCKLWRDSGGEFNLRQLVMYRLSGHTLSDDKAETTALNVEHQGDIDLFLWEQVKLVWEGGPGSHTPSRDELIAEGKRTGVCQVCHRKLTNPESIKKGIGPVCEGRI